MRRATLREHRLAKSAVLHSALAFIVAHDGLIYIAWSPALDLISLLVIYEWRVTIVPMVRWRTEASVLCQRLRDNMRVVINPSCILRTRTELNEGVSLKRIRKHELWLAITYSIHHRFNALFDWDMRKANHSFL